MYFKYPFRPAKCADSIMGEISLYMNYSWFWLVWAWCLHLCKGSERLWKGWRCCWSISRDTREGHLWTERVSAGAVGTRRVLMPSGWRWNDCMLLEEQSERYLYLPTSGLKDLGRLFGRTANLVAELTDHNLPSQYLFRNVHGFSYCDCLFTLAKHTDSALSY